MTPLTETTQQILSEALAGVSCVEAEESAARKCRYDYAVLCGKALRHIRLERGISLRAAAKRLQISAAYLSDMELGRRMPSAHYLTDMATLEDL